MLSSYTADHAAGASPGPKPLRAAIPDDESLVFTDRLEKEGEYKTPKKP